MKEYDFFVSSTFYKNMKIIFSFDKVNYGSGYGIIIKKNKKKF